MYYYVYYEFTNLGNNIPFFLFYILFNIASSVVFRLRKVYD